MADSLPAIRPFSVSLVVFFTVLGGVLDIIGGVALIILSAMGSVRDAMQVGAGTLIAVGAFYAILGLVTVIVGLKLRSGSSGARMVVTVIEVIRIVFGLIGGFVVGFDAATGTQTVVTVLMALIVLGLLWNGRANAFFQNPAV
jgi:hypothetical protein